MQVLSDKMLFYKNMILYNQCILKERKNRKRTGDKLFLEHNEEVQHE